MFVFVCQISKTMLQTKYGLCLGPRKKLNLETIHVAFSDDPFCIVLMAMLAEIKDTKKPKRVSFVD